MIDTISQTEIVSLSHKLLKGKQLMWTSDRYLKDIRRVGGGACPPPPPPPLLIVKIPGMVPGTGGYHPLTPPLPPLREA